MDNMITEWSEISANTIEALKIMGMGMLAIFIVIAIITLVVYILNVTDKKMQAKKLQAKEIASSTPAPMIPNNTNASAEPSATPVEKQKASINMSELGESKYRKGMDADTENRYRKRDENE